MALKKYQVVSGIHVVNGDPNSPYRQGAIVAVEEGPKDAPLTKRFVNKFIEVGLPTVPMPITDERRAQVSELIDSESFDEADREMLHGLTDDQFGRLFGKHFKAKQAAEEEPGKPPTNALGEDVTDKFPQAKAAGYKVYANAAGVHQVVKPDGKRKVRPLNTSPLKEADVEEFVKDLQKT